MERGGRGGGGKDGGGEGGGGGGGNYGEAIGWAVALCSIEGKKR